MRTLSLFASIVLVAASLPAPAQPTDLTRMTDLRYRCIGPTRGGRATTVTGVPSDPGTFYMGSTGGGVWKTTDYGQSWRNVSDGFFESASIGAMRVAPADHDTIYVGTGSDGLRSNVITGRGMYKSTDAGRTWSFIGLRNAGQIGAVEIHPGDANLVYVAVIGQAFGKSEERGVYRTKDGGVTWDRIKFVNEHAGCVDLAMDPTNPRILYATFWRILRTPYSLESGGEGSTLWKSADGGESWTELTGNRGLPKGTLGIMGITVSPSNPDNLYCIIEAEKGGVFRSRDGGKTWRETNNERSLRQRAWYYTRIFADPQDEDVVYVLNVGFHRSKDGGRTFGRISVPHGDNHDLWIDPADPKRMIQSNDGGANVSFDGGRTWTPQDTQPTAQMYRVSVDNAFPYRLLGGQQDNSAVRIRSRSAFGRRISERDWEPTAGGESGHVVAQPGNPDVVYGGSYGGTLARVDHATGERRSVHVWPDNPMGWGAAELRYRFQWNFPLFFSPHDPRKLYTAANVLFRTTDEGQSWQELSPDLTRDDETKMGPSGGPITKDNTSVEYYGTIFAAFESPHEEGVIWCGSDDGLVQLTRDDGGSWTDVTPPDLPEWTQVNCLEPHPTEPGGCYLAGTRYKLDDFEPYLFKTLDYGANWERIDAGIERDHFTRALRADPGRAGLLYAGTERGVYVSFDDGASWRSLQLDLPIVPVTDLAVKEGDLVAATQGRGYWILDDLSSLHQFEPEQPGTVHLYQPRPALRVGMRRRDETVGAGANPLGGAVFSYLLPEVAPGAEAPEVELEILEADGTPVRSFTAQPAEGSDPPPLPPHLSDDPRQLPTEKGFNRFAWNLRYPGAEKFPKMILWAGNLSGPRAVPGTYRARLTVGDETREVEFELRPDPRSSASLEDLRAQFEFLSQVRDDLTRAHRAIRRLRDTKAQLADIAKRLGGDGAYEAIVPRAQELKDELGEIEKVLYQTKNESRQDPLNFPIRLTDKLAGVRSSADVGDWRPTAQAYAVRAMLAEAIDTELGKLETIWEQELPAFNGLAADAGVPAVLPLVEGDADAEEE